MSELLVNVQGGARICVPASLGNFTTFVLLEQETWFEDELGFVRAALAPGEQAIDVGANVGVFTVAMAAAVGAQGRVLALEPTSGTAALLRRTVAENALAQVAVVQSAASERRGKATLQLGHSPEFNTLTETPAAGSQTEQVELVPLDELVAEQRLDAPAFLKVDAEGHEVPIARGAARLLQAHEPTVLFEVRHGEQNEYGMLEHLQALGFAGYRLLPGPGVLVPFDRNAPADPALLNLVAVTPRRAETLVARGLLARDASEAAETPAPDDDARAYLAGLPGGGHGQPGGAYGEALACIAALQASDVEGREVALLARARRLAEQAWQEKGSLVRALTLARLYVDLGERRRAIELVASLIERVRVAGRLALDEPCLPPVPRYAALDPGPDPTAWLQSLVIEAFVRLVSYSSMFRKPEQTLPLLDFLAPRPFYCAEMERRRQLVRIGTRLQPGPEPHPLLTQLAPDNLNPRIWGGRP